MKSSNNSSKPLTSTIALILFAYFAIAVVTLYFLNPAYDLIRSFAGYYDPGSYEFLVATTFFALGLASLALVIGLYQGMSRSVGTRMGLLLLGIWSLGILIAGIFPANEGSSTIPQMITALIAGIFPVEVMASPETTFSFIHVLSILGAQLSLTIAAIVLTWRFRLEERWRSTYRFSLPLAMVMTAAAILFFPVILFGIHPQFFRLSWNVLTFSSLFWLVLIAIRLHILGNMPVSP